MSVTANIAQQIDVKPRTKDVICCESVDFSSFLLSDTVLKGLKDAGFEKASPIQIKSIPLGTCGLDLIVQAKSGTGKTCVFTVVALNNLVIQSSSTQVLVLAPTREIAVQIWEVINAIGAHMEGLRCYTFIGGLPVVEDKEKLKKCHIAVGTPGRVKQLIEEGALTTESVRLFVLDEADKLMEGGFQEVINWIFSSLPENKQMLALSATYPESLAQHLTAYMRNPTFIRLNSDDPALMGIRQYYKKVAFHPLVQKAFQFKITELMNILSSVAFNQCLVFSNYQARAESLSNSLNDKGWPSTHISGAQDQVDRLTAMATLKKYKCRVLVSTDLTSRGIDAEHINLVINLDVPKDHDTYLHRIGRAGRFGSFGAGITLASEGKEVAQLLSIQEKCKTTINLLPDPIPNDLAHSSGYVDIDKLVITETVVPKIMIDDSKAPSASVKIPEEKSVKQQEIADQDEHKESTEQVNEQTGEILTKTEEGSKRKILKSRRKGSGAKKAPWADWLTTSEDSIRVETASRESVRDSVMYDDVDIFSNAKPKKSKDRKKKIATEKDSSKSGQCNSGFDNETKNDSVDLERNKENVGPGGDARVNQNVVYEMDETRGDSSNIGKQSCSYSNKKPTNKSDVSPKKLTYGSKDINGEAGNSDKRMDNVSTRTQRPVKPAKKELKDMSYEQLLASYVHHRKKEDEGLSSDGSISSDKDTSERKHTEKVEDKKVESSSAINNGAALKTESDTQLSSPKVENICVTPVQDQLQQGEFEQLKCELKEMLYAKRYPKPTVVRCYKSIHQEYLEELEKLKKLDDRQKQEELKKLYAEGEKKKDRAESQALDHKLLCSKVDKMLKHINSIHTEVQNPSDDSKEQDSSTMPKETVAKGSAIDNKDVVPGKVNEIQKDNASENIGNTMNADLKSTDFKVVTNKGITDLKQEEIVKPKKPMFLGMKATRMEPSPLNAANNSEATQTPRFSEKPDHRKESDKKKSTLQLEDNAVSSILKQKCDKTADSAPSDSFGVEYIRKLGALQDSMRNDNRESLEEGELSGSDNNGKVDDCNTQKAANVRQTMESKKKSSNSRPQRRGHPYGPWEPVEPKKETPDIEEIQKEVEPVLEDQIYHNDHCDDEYGRDDECNGYEEPFEESYHHGTNDVHSHDRFETERDDYDWYDQNGYYRQDDSYFNVGRNFDSEMPETRKRFPHSHNMNRAGYPSYRSQSYGCPDQFEMWPRKPFRMGDHHLAFSQFEQAQSAMWASYMNHVYWMNQPHQYSRAEQYNYLSTVHSQWADYYETLYKNSKKTKKNQPKP